MPNGFSFQRSIRECGSVLFLGMAKEIFNLPWLRIIQISTRSKNIFPKNKKDLGVACHTPRLKKVKKEKEMPLPSCSLSPIPLKKMQNLGMGWDREGEVTQ